MDKHYRIIRGAIKVSYGQSTGRAGMLVQGDLLPLNFPKADIGPLLREGRIEEANVSAEQVTEQEVIQKGNPFCVEPSILVGKTREEMIIMVLEIDEDYDIDLLITDQDFVALLTSGWDPRFAQKIAPVNDKSRPTQLAIDKMGQDEHGSRGSKSSNTDMSEKARLNLEAAKLKAQGSLSKSQQDSK